MVRRYKGKIIDEELDKRMSKVKFFIEADSFAQHELWGKWANDALKFMGKHPDHELLDWQQDHSGFSLTIDEIKYKRETFPIVVSCSFATLNGQYVCFYYGCSMLVHHEIIEDFLKTNWPVKYDKGTRLAFTNASNFHNCAHFCQEERNKRYRLTTHDYD
jgi:hypothetical protein